MPKHFVAHNVPFVFDVTLGTADDQHLVMPHACNVVRIDSVIMGVLTVADEVLTFENDAAVALTGGAITITQAASADGDIDSVTPTANNSFAAGEKLTCAIGGENGTATVARITVWVELT
jgi:hypothetical protein